MATHNIPLFVWLSFISLSLIPILAQRDNYIVHMDLSAMPKAFSDKHNWFLATLASVSKISTTTTNSISSSPKLIYSYRHVINGFSASLIPDELEALKISPGYISCIRDLPVKKDTTHSPKFLQLDPNSGAWAVSHFGQDVIIGLVDTGVWPESESFNDNGMTEIPSRWKGECEIGTQFNSSMCNKKLIGARFFNKGLIATNVTISLNSTRDTEGHGTHTSSTAAGNYVEGASYFGYATGTASGIAPRAHVAMYKALWDEGGQSSDIIAAIDQAIMDGVDVLSMSLGVDGVALYEDPIAIATFSALEKGIFVSTSAGNEGPYFGSLHNGTPWVLTVAAGTMDREFGATLTLGSGVSIFGLALYPENFSSSQLPIVFMDACDNLAELKKVGQKIVVCVDNTDSVRIQTYNVLTANVVAGIFITNSTNVEFSIQTSFPAIFVKLLEGETIKDYIKKSSKPEASIKFQITSLGTKPAPSVTSYSSRGPSSSCPFVLKPDITAPGDLVLAAWPSNSSVTTVSSGSLYSDFNLLSGTSMSCPHAAGVAALLKGAHPEWSPAAIRSAMMTTSDSIDNTKSPIKDIGDDYQPASPISLGAGHINPNKALDPGLIYDATRNDYVNLLCALNFTTKQMQTITKSATDNCSTPSLDINYPSFIVFFNANDSKSDLKTVHEFTRTVTNVGQGISTYTATVPASNGFNVSVVPDKLEFTEFNQKQSFTLSIELEGSKLMNKTLVSGYLIWVDEEGKHEVKSPIVATSLSF
ncbi:Peptidase_S8 domain-containing protein/Inhibitor_I9 domain-containing protein [Cephalotus follicularis]|uniref:Peptidase_S8 domain-containing protein/Inhibitor_I9 domain-containing protein n=1 Tax=Cephalotus follicularis TaxID=3775 RepID=A0A1Q3CGW3_CEPFO|nr:Peptidase_S8 domain-containing protein/Inhibitor_I9 domain-containing protein [Cephalotus follicularis]